MDDLQQKLKLRRLLMKLGNYYWTPTHPSYYAVKLQGGQTIGLGTLAAENYGLFNLIWASCPLMDLDQHRNAMSLFNSLKSDMPVVAGQSLSDWLTQLTPTEYKGWFEKHKAELPPAFIVLSVRAIHALEQVREIRR